MSHHVRHSATIQHATVVVAMALALASTRPVAAQLTAATLPAPSVLLPVGRGGGPATAVNAAASAAANVLTLRINSGGAQSIDDLLDGRINAFPLPVSVTTQWELSVAATIDLVAYFASPSAALASGSDVIPTAYVNGRMTTGLVRTFTSFTGNEVSGAGVPGASLHLFRQGVVVAVNGLGERTDALELQLDLRTSPSLAPGQYRGTLTLRAVAY